MKEIAEGHIVVAYTGNLANRIEWDEKKLTELEDKSDLGSVITIRSITQRIPSGSVQMGETLAMTSYKSPLEVLALNHPNEITHTRIDFVSGASDIMIDDQLATDKAVDKKTRQISESKFVSDINESVKAGLDDLITKEKIYNAKTTLKFYTAILPAVLGIAGGGYLLTTGLSDLLSSMFLDVNSLMDSISHTKTIAYNRDANDFRYFMGMVKMISGANGLLAMLRVSVFASRKLRPEGKLSYLYLNPLKPLKDIVNTKFYLAGKSKKLVGLKK